MSAARLLRRRGIARKRRGVVPPLQFHPLRGHSADLAIVDDPAESFAGIDRSCAPALLCDAVEVYFDTQPDLIRFSGETLARPGSDIVDAIAYAFSAFWRTPGDRL